MIEFFIEFYVEEKQQCRRCHLSDHRRVCSALYSHFRNGSDSVNHNRIEDDIYYRTHNLTNGGIK